jgi:hypothetical protein
MLLIVLMKYVVPNSTPPNSDVENVPFIDPMLNPKLVLVDVLVPAIEALDEEDSVNAAGDVLTVRLPFSVVNETAPPPGVWLIVKVVGLLIART